MSPILIQALAAALYLAIALAIWRSHRPLGEPLGANVLRASLLAPLAVHALWLAINMTTPGALQFGFAPALSITLWLTVVIYWIESFFLRLDGLLAIALPLAALAVLLPAAFPGFALPLEADATALRVHLLTAMVAYSLFTVAALQGLVMAILERRLHAGTLSGVFTHVPPLLTLERVLFRIIGAGLLLLTAALVTGVLFSETLFGRALRIDHKTVFALLSWVIFAALLAGRWLRGWRGRTALRWIVAGFVCLLLAYIGSRFVFEVILGRSPV